jgi:hypothetical protein
MATEGMVHALRRVRQLAGSGGLVIDLHPTAEPAWVEVGGERAGPVEAGDAPARHAEASAALKTALSDGVFIVEDAGVFQFFTYADSIEELNEHIRQTWRSGRIEEPVVERARAAIRRSPGTRPRVCEHVQWTRMRPANGASRQSLDRF